MSPPWGYRQLGRHRLPRPRLPRLLMLTWFARSCRMPRLRFLLSSFPPCNLFLNQLFFGRIRYSALFIIFWRRTSAGRLALVWRLVRTLGLLMRMGPCYIDAFCRRMVGIDSAGRIAQDEARRITSAVLCWPIGPLLICLFVSEDLRIVGSMLRLALPSTRFMSCTLDRLLWL
uniref:ORF4 n=1 Tax=Rocahepevirus ratti TaxID=1678145 RepID=A0A2P1MBR3_9VIRU|nr:ORF4 [Rocahepevirus ratti]